MRSPWQLIKGFASRRHSDEAIASFADVVPTSDTQLDVFEQRSERQRKLEAQPGTNAQSSVGGNETNLHLPPMETDAQRTLPAAQTGPLPSQVAVNVSPNEQDQPAPVAPVARTIDGKVDTNTLITRSNERRKKALHARRNARTRALVQAAVEQTVAVKKTAVDEAAELDLEINSLRLHLSAKLFEQNKQLRRMIERYGDR